MKFHLILLITLNIFGVLQSLPNPKENSSIPITRSAPAEPITNVISSDVIPGFTQNVEYLGGIQPQQYFQPSTCTSGCAAGGQCPSYCSQAPGLCSSGCQVQRVVPAQIQTITPQIQPIIPQIQQLPPQNVTVNVPVRTSKIVPEKLTRTVQKLTKTVKVAMKQEVLKQCPRGFRMVDHENEIEECIEDETRCPMDYELRGERCIRTVTACANEHVKSYQNCSLRVVCPMNFRLSGNECIPPEPKCPYNWDWNGKVCEPQRLTCPSGYTLSHDDQCTRELQRCPPAFREYGDQCIKDQPSCAFEFMLNRQNNVCEKTVNKCPQDAYEQNGECLNYTQECPTGTKDEGNHCSYEQTSQKIVYEM